MLFRILSMALCAMILSVNIAGAQSLARLGGPVNLPPAGFDGQQFVDNRGCLFLRAGFGATVTWVPRVDRGHRPLCGFPPTFGAPVVIEVAEEPVAPVVAAPVVVAAAAPEVVAPAAPRQGSLLAALFGAPTRTQAVVAVEESPVVARPAAAVAVAVAAPVPVIPKPPKGYKLAWTDDRLNPMRGIGTAKGQAQQDQVWTRDVPAVLVAAPVAPAARAGTVAVSTMSAPEASAAAYVQVGSFGEAANVEAAKALLRTLGLPVATQKVTRKGKALVVVFAGPFGGAGAAEAALVAARQAGFGDAVLR